MSEAQQRPKHPHLLLNIIIIVLETFFSFIFNHDAALRLQAKKLIDRKVTIRINSYIPFFDFYVQFTEKGILFDMEALGRNVDFEINSTLIDLIKIFVLNHQRSIYNMRMLGDAKLIEAFMDLVPYLTLSSILGNWRQWFNDFTDDSQAIASEKRIAPLLEKIDQQRSEINTLLVEVKQYQNRINRLQKRQRLINIGFSVLSFILVVLLVYNIWVK